jgi:hypothetical protein
MIEDKKTKKDKCIKCGSRDICTTWQDKGKEYKKVNKGHYNTEVLKEERLFKHCRNCDYEWTEKTLDNQKLEELNERR